MVRECFSFYLAHVYLGGEKVETFSLPPHLVHLLLHPAFRAQKNHRLDWSANLPVPLVKTSLLVAGTIVTCLKLNGVMLLPVLL